jgi:hypothetical protein
MSYELTNASCWEYVLIDEKRPEARDPMADLEASSSTSATGSSMLAADGKPLAPEEVFDDREVLDAPVSWTAPISIDRETFLARYPGNYKKVPYKRSVLEKFSEYVISNTSFIQHHIILCFIIVCLLYWYLCHNRYQEGKAGLIEKISMYDTDEFKVGHDELEIRETFAHRKYCSIITPSRAPNDRFAIFSLFIVVRVLLERRDKLRQRNTFPRDRRVHEMFHPGRPSCLKDFVTVEGKQRLFEFYPRARVDGMIKREEKIGHKVSMPILFAAYGD